jgi:hypothetical protein
MNRPSGSSMATMKFASYNEAIQFSKQSGMLQASKPYKRTAYKDGETVVIWCVTMPNMRPSTATYQRIEEQECNKVRMAA